MNTFLKVDRTFLASTFSVNLASKNARLVCIDETKVFYTDMPDATHTQSIGELTDHQLQSMKVGFFTLSAILEVNIDYKYMMHVVEIKVKQYHKLNKF